MLYRVEVENFCSIREPQVIDLRVAANVPDIPGRFAPAWPGAEQRVPKTIAIFGANASGKSTVLKIVSFLASFVLHSFAAQPTHRIMFDRFNDVEALGQPARFAVEFGGLADLSDPALAAECRYRYELEIRRPRQRAGAGLSRSAVLLAGARGQASDAVRSPRGRQGRRREAFRPWRLQGVAADGPPAERKRDLDPLPAEAPAGDADLGKRLDRDLEHLHRASPTSPTTRW